MFTARTWTKERPGLAVIEQFELSHPTPKALRRKLDFLGLRRALEEMQDLIPFVDAGPRFLGARERYCFLTTADHRPVDEAQLWAEYNIEHHLQSNPRGPNQVPGTLSFFPNLMLIQIHPINSAAGA